MKGEKEFEKSNCNCCALNFQPKLTPSQTCDRIVLKSVKLDFFKVLKNAKEFQLLVYLDRDA